jgi:hypothetical protein
MKRRRLLSLYACLLLAAAALAPLPAEAAEHDAPGDLVVTLQPGTSVDAINVQYGTEAMGNIPGTTTYRLHAARSKRVLKQLRKNAKVIKASADGVVRRQQTVGFPHDTPEPVGPAEDPGGLYRSQIGESGQLEALQVDSARTLTESGEEIVVAVLDTGVDAGHEALSGRLWTNPGEVPGNGLDDDADGYVDDVAGWNFVASSADPSESAGAISGHGTFISGLIALTAPKARIMPLKVLDGDGVGSAFDASAAINFAVQHGARVVSMSFGADGRTPPRVLREAVASARALNVVLVAAVGNNASDFIAYPASDKEHVISVGSTDQEQARAPFSNYAPDAVDVWAPGVDVVSAMPGAGGTPRYARWSGTSFSTALVSAGCSVLLSTAAVSDPGDVRERIRSNGPDNPDGTGKQVNFFEAVGSVLRDAGELDVWTNSYLGPLVEGSEAGGFAILRTIGQAQRMTICAWGMGTTGRYDVYMSPIDDPEAFVRVNTDGPVVADNYGNLKFVAANDARPAEGTARLPIPIDRAAIVAFVDADDNTPTIAANVDPANQTVATWAGVGLRAVSTSDPDRAPFARAWYGFAPDEGGPHQAFAVASCQVEARTEYALVVNGAVLLRATSSDDGNGFGSITFFFSNDPDAIRHDHAVELSEATTPEISPVTRIHQVALAKVERNGGLTPVLAGDFVGDGAKVLDRLGRPR